MEKLKEMYAGAFLITSASWILAHLILIKIQGIVRITESNDWILWVEIALMIGIICLGVERLIRDIKNGR